MQQAVACHIYLRWKTPGSSCSIAFKTVDVFCSVSLCLCTFHSLRSLCLNECTVLYYLLCFFSFNYYAFVQIVFFVFFVYYAYVQYSKYSKLFESDPLISDIGISASLVTRGGVMDHLEMNCSEINLNNNPFLCS